MLYSGLAIPFGLWENSENGTSTVSYFAYFIELE